MSTLILISLICNSLFNVSTVPHLDSISEKERKKKKKKSSFMELEMSANNNEYVDWRGRRANPKKHGGIRAASIPCVVVVIQNMVYLCNASTFVEYFIILMHYSAAESAIMVTNVMGTSYLLTILGGFISDSFFARFTTFIFCCLVELLGLTVLTVQAQYQRFQPATGSTPSSSQVAMLYTGLYAMALGVGGTNAALPAHGADQFDHKDQRRISSFFNWFFFSMCIGAFIAATVMVWVAENKGWQWNLKISLTALSVGLCIFMSGSPLYRFKSPSGSPIARIFRVCVSAAKNWKASPADMTQDGVNSRSHEKFKCLDKALNDDTISVTDVEETKTFLGLLPIFASTIMMNCCLAQLQTFSIQQGQIMNRKINGFQIPVQSLTVIPLIVMLTSISIYERFIKSKLLKKDSALIQPLCRIGLGLTLASGSMAFAVVFEDKRREAAQHKVTLSVFWLVGQYLFLGVSDMLTLGGMLEFFYLEAPDGMRSMCTALSWCSTSMGFFLSSILVTITNSVSGRFGREWLGGNDLNQCRLDLFYTILCILNFLNLLNYMYWAKRY